MQEETRFPPPAPAVRPLFHPPLNAFCVFDMTERKTCFLAIRLFFSLSPFTAAASLTLSLSLSLSVALSPPSTKLYPEIYDSKNFLALSSARTADAAAAAADAAHRCLTGGASEREREGGRKDNITNHGMAQGKEGASERGEEDKGALFRR